MVVPPKCFKTGHSHRDIHPRSFRVTFYFNVHTPSTYLSNTSYTLGRLNSEYWWWLFYTKPGIFFSVSELSKRRSNSLYLFYIHTVILTITNRTQLFFYLCESAEIEQLIPIKKNRINAVLNPKSIDEIKPEENHEEPSKNIYNFKSVS